VGVRRWRIRRGHLRRKTKVAEGTVAAGKRSGRWTLWRKDDATEIVGKGSYLDDKRHGAWQILVDGKLVQTLGFAKDELVTVDGKRATQAFQNGFAMVPVFPAVIEASERGPFP
jgi:hypothetical protein